MSDDEKEQIEAFDPTMSPAKDVKWPSPLFVGRYVSLRPGVTISEIREADERLDTVTWNLGVEASNDDPPKPGETIVYEYTEYVPKAQLDALRAELEAERSAKDALARRLIEVQR